MSHSDNAGKRSKVQEIVPLLYVTDMQRSLDFYTQKLGFLLDMDWCPDNQLKWCRLEREGAALMLQLLEASHDYRFDKNQLGAGIAFFFNCNDVELIRDEFVQGGLDVPEIETAFYGMKQLEMSDPDGYQLCFQSPVVGG